MLPLIEYERSLMDGAPGDPYPDSEAEVWQVVELANTYYHAAVVLFRDAKAKGPLAFADAFRSWGHRSSILPPPRSASSCFD